MITNKAVTKEGKDDDDGESAVVVVVVVVVVLVVDDDIIGKEEQITECRVGESSIVTACIGSTESQAAKMITFSSVRTKGDMAL